MASALRDLIPFGMVNPGPFNRNDWRSRLRRLIEGALPVFLHWRIRRIQLALLMRERLRDIPKIALPLHPAWITRADVERGEQLVRERKLP